MLVVNHSTVVDEVLEMSLGFGTAEDDVIVAKFSEQLARHVVNGNGSIFFQDPRDILEPRVVVVDQPIAALFQMIEWLTVPWVYHFDVRPKFNDPAKRPKKLSQQSTSTHIAPTNVGRDRWQNMVTRKEMSPILQADRSVSMPGRVDDFQLPGCHLNLLTVEQPTGLRRLDLPGSLRGIARLELCLLWYIPLREPVLDQDAMSSSARICVVDRRTFTFVNQDFSTGFSLNAPSIADVVDVLVSQYDTANILDR